ncbi:type II toxin-antitoxin system VapC family toxin [Nocardia callitridis]|uniref:Type II toxin-antitoxin system VapC family toxin n=1 Tax=Nocardia callitridis TaxID=648753 RepID=A0ABP9JTZ7_9NOCA
MASSPTPINGLATLLDACVLLDVMTQDKKWAKSSGEKISEALDRGRVVINPIVYAEVSVGYSSIEQLNDLLPADAYEREPLPFHAGFLAGKAFQRYRRNSGEKRSPMPDFYIGAHAAVTGYRLLTRDVARYRGYFPTVELVIPGQ